MEAVIAAAGRTPDSVHGSASPRTQVARFVPRRRPAAGRATPSPGLGAFRPARGAGQARTRGGRRGDRQPGGPGVGAFRCARRWPGPASRRLARDRQPGAMGVGAFRCARGTGQAPGSGPPRRDRQPGGPSVGAFRCARGTGQARARDRRRRTFNRARWAWARSGAREAPVRPGSRPPARDRRLEGCGKSRRSRPIPSGGRDPVATSLGCERRYESATNRTRSPVHGSRDESDRARRRTDE